MVLPKLAQTPSHCNRFDTMVATTHFDTPPVIPPLALRWRRDAAAFATQRPAESPNITSIEQPPNQPCQEFSLGR
jgi:hypothetical protein